MSPLSSTYFVFTAIALLLYWQANGVKRLRLSILWLANGYFLARMALYLPLLFALTSSIDFALGAGLSKYENKWLRRALLGLSLTMNLGLLVATRVLPLHNDEHWRWVFPLSLSFYCFQSLSYTFDAYNRTRPTTKSLLAHLCGNTLFLSIVAGPINRMGRLIEQLEAPFSLTRERMSRAILLISSGLIKKLLLADALSTNLVDRIFDTPTLYSGAEALIAAFGYSLQLYYDFSGYTDIALGLGELFGLQLPENFRRPYLAENVREFWKHWHISFSEWIHDYIYGSLAKVLPNAKRWPIVVYVNLLLTMLLSGLWHGFSWSFVIWGALHGLGLMWVRFYFKLRGGVERPRPRWRRALAIVFTFCYVTLAWVFFRASDAPNALAVLARIGSGAWTTVNISSSIVWTLLAAAVGCLLPERSFDWCVERFAKTPLLVQAATLAAAILLTQYLAGSASAPFVYSHF